MEDWDLQAVVRGYCAAAAATTTATTNIRGASAEDPSWSLLESLLDLDQEESVFSFPDLSSEASSRAGLEELEQLYKPFFPKFEPISPPHHTSLPIITPPIFNHQQQKQQHQQVTHSRSSNHVVSGSGTNHSSNQSQTPRPKRRKNQQKRVVCQVPAEGLSSDMWAWRKYGQKPIKGSPYPRGYYRCSSSKGCLARKQVERSRSDPGMFVITYTAEHNHPVPTHRNSLAGSTRNKSSSATAAGGGATTSTAADSDPTTTTTVTTNNSKPSSPASTNTGLSPTTPLESNDDQEGIVDQEVAMDGPDEADEGVLIPEGLLSDDLFNGLDELSAAGAPNSGGSPAFDDCFSDHFPATFSSPWFTAAAAGGG
ncbi:hypothetical protein Scep_006144 [Stephania cephalantha]|uniref:WRKY domain-containing protein n=1 Tax=Stephania cephalantha TaxID=152367 RepID=A0AAP0K7M0_9MAGN